MPGVFNPNYTTAAAIKNNLINYFLTNPGERPLNPTFGGGLRAFIFQQITTDNLDFLEERISTDLEQFFPNVAVGNLEILRQEDTNTITVSLTYSVINTNINDTLEIDFK
jgi:phage baseplate assembly protein W